MAASISVFFTLVEPSIDVVLTAHRSQYTTTPHHVYFTVRESVLNGSALKHAQFQWWVYKTATLEVVDSSNAGPEFSCVLTEANDYTVKASVRVNNDTAWTSETLNFTVGTPSYQRECWVDMGAGVNGTGSLASPFNSIISGVAYIDANWVNGHTNEHAIHLKRNTTGLLTAGFGTKSFTGRYVFDTYGDGPRPTFLLSGELQVLRCNDNTALVWNGIKIDGQYENLQTGPANETIRKTCTQANNPSGFNVIVHDSEFVRSKALSVYTNVTATTSAFITGGHGDFVALSNCYFDYNAANALIQDSRYMLNTSTFGIVGGTYAFRSSLINNGYIRTTQTGQSGSNIPQRIHGAHTITGCTSNWVVFDRCKYLGAPWIQPDDGNLTAKALNNVWFSRCFVETISGITKCIDFGINSGLVVRNNVFNKTFGTAACGTVRAGVTGTSNYSDWLIEHNTFVNQAVTVDYLAWDFITSSESTLSGVIFRNNLMIAPNKTNTTYAFRAQYNTPAPTDLFTECNNNYFYGNIQTTNWALGFTTGNGSLASWQAQTPFDQGNSIVVTGGTWPIVNASGMNGTLDVTLRSGSYPIDKAGNSPGTYVDFSGFIRPNTSSTKDIGAMEYGTTQLPSLS